MYASYFCIFLAILVTVECVDVRSCTGGRKFKSDDIIISNCSKPPCRLKRRTTVEAIYNITPEKDVKSLKNTVFARVLGIPLPFVGVDNTDACKNIFTKEGEKAGCPLKAGQTYMYKNSFKILPVYPTISVEVHWALTTPEGKDILCFELPARITN